MGKIGILTFHRALSYGAVLQSYGLQNFLLKNNIDNEIVDYRCQYMIDHYQKVIRKTKGNRLKGFLWSLYTAPDVVKSRKLMKAFVDKNLKMSCPYNSTTVKKVKDKYSRFICGSDQVWSPTCVGFDPVYFLNFAENSQKYSYSASIATAEIPENIKSEFTKRISDFSGYSLRENSGKELVEKLTGKKAQVHIDPSLLLEKQDWDKVASEKTEKEPYILLFTIHKGERLVRYALDLAEKTGLRILYLNNKSPKKHKRIKYLSPVSPDEFISLVKNAEYVCTNSFHGTAFSLIYRKNFIAETETKGRKNIRCQELMEYLGLDNRCLKTENQPDINAKSNWDFVENKLIEEREKSLKYLMTIK